MTKEEFEAALASAIDQRENGDTLAAMRHLEQLASWAKVEGEHELFCKALVHTIIADQHLADLGHQDYEVMASRADEGLLFVQQHPEVESYMKQFHFRLGVARFMQDRYPEADTHLSAALSEISKYSPEYPEFASQAGIAAFMNGRYTFGGELLIKANAKFRALMDQDPPYFEPWHAKIIECGLEMRNARMWHKLDDALGLRVSMNRARLLAEELKNMGKTMRMVQYENLVKKLSYQEPPHEPK